MPFYKLRTASNEIFNSFTPARHLSYYLLCVDNMKVLYFRLKYNFIKFVCSYTILVLLVETVPWAILSNGQSIYDILLYYPIEVLYESMRDNHINSFPSLNLTLFWTTSRKDVVDTKKYFFQYNLIRICSKKIKTIDCRFR
jgi:hypothetical protein